MNAEYEKKLALIEQEGVFSKREHQSQFDKQLLIENENKTLKNQNNILNN